MLLLPLGSGSGSEGAAVVSVSFTGGKGPMKDAEGSGGGPSSIVPSLALLLPWFWSNFWALTTGPVVPDPAELQTKLKQAAGFPLPNGEAFLASPWVIPCPHGQF